MSLMDKMGSYKEQKAGITTPDLTEEFAELAGESEVTAKAKEEVERLASKSDDDDLTEEERELVEQRAAERKARAAAHAEETSIIDEVENDLAYAEEPTIVIESEVVAVDDVFEEPVTEEVQSPIEIEEEEEPIKEEASRESVMSAFGSTTQPTINDTLNADAFKTVKATVGVSPTADSYAEMIEGIVVKQCELSGVTNLDLTTFGLRAQALTFRTLDVMEYGIHKFLGKAFTEEQRRIILHRIALAVANSKENPVVLKAAVPVRDEDGLVYHSLQFDQRIAEEFATLFEHEVKINPNEVDISKLVMLVYKKQ